MSSGRDQAQDQALPLPHTREPERLEGDGPTPAQTLAQGELSPHTPQLSEKQLEALRANQFQKGKSGNPGGKPKAEITLREMARGYTKEAVDKLVTLMRTARDAKVQMRAAEILLDRGYGKVAQAQQPVDDGKMPGDEIPDEAIDKILDA